MQDGKHVILCIDDDPDIIETLKIVLEAKSELYGEIKTRKLIIDEGATFDGKCTMTGDTKTEHKSVSLPPEIEPEETDSF